MVLMEISKMHAFFLYTLFLAPLTIFRPPHKVVLLLISSMGFKSVRAVETLDRLSLGQGTQFSLPYNCNWVSGFLNLRI